MYLTWAQLAVDGHRKKISIYKVKEMNKWKETIALMI